MMESGARGFRRAVVAAVLVASSVLAPHAQASRVVSIIPATTEMLFAMGAGTRGVGVGSYDRFPADVEKLPRVGALLDPDVERIIALRPDLVVLYGTQAELRKALDRANIPYYAYTHRGLADITGTIRSLGARVGMATQADAGFLHDMLEAAGATDVLADVHHQSVMMSTEMILARAPDVIVELRYTRADAAGDTTAWNTLPSVPAVRRHRVYVLRGEALVVPGPRVAEATEQLARTLHPEAFR